MMSKYQEGYHIYSGLLEWIVGEVKLRAFSFWFGMI